MTNAAAKSNETGTPPATMILLAAGLAGLTFAIHFRAVQFDFVNFDDDVHVYQNPHVTGGVTEENMRWAFGIHGPSQWHPLAWLSHQLDCEMYGLWPGGHHLTSVVWHAANVLVLFLLLVNITGAAWRSALVAALFAVHPLNVESVTWISERRNVLCLFFCLLTLHAYAAYARKQTATRYGLVIVFFWLAIMSKPLAVTLPCLMLLLDYWPLNRIGGGGPSGGPDAGNGGSGGASWRILIAEKIPLLLLAAGASVLTVWCQEGVIATSGLLPLSLRLLNALAAYGIYLRQTVWPSDLAVFYPHPGFVAADAASELFWPAMWGALVLIAATILALVNLRRRPYLAVGWFWYLGTLVPMIGLVQVGRQQMADRYVYLPLIGILIAVVWSLPDAARMRRRSILRLRLAAAGTVLALAIVSWVQVGYWRDSVTLFERAIGVTQRNSWSHNNLGQALHERGASVRAVEQLSEALRIDPEYGLARYNLGVVLHDRGNPGQAVLQFQEALRLMPEHVGARLRLGIALADLGRLDEAVPVFRQAVEISPNTSQAHLNLGIALARQGNQREANACFRGALELDPENAAASYSLAVGLSQSGNLAEAEQQFLRLLEMTPGNALAHNEFGKLLLEMKNRNQAMEHFREAVRLNPRLGEAELNLRRAMGE